jgi:hypothetical protein
VHQDSVARTYRDATAVTPIEEISGGPEAAYCGAAAVALTDARERQGGRASASVLTARTCSRARRLCQRAMADVGEGANAGATSTTHAY